MPPGIGYGKDLPKNAIRRRLMKAERMDKDSKSKSLPKKDVSERVKRGLKMHNLLPKDNKK